MKRKIKYPKSFSKKIVKIVEGNHRLKNSINDVFLKLEDNPFDPSLGTHALTGNLKGSYACSITHALRITFILTNDTIHLLNIGTHDEVY